MPKSRVLATFFASFLAFPAQAITIDFARNGYGAFDTYVVNTVTTTAIPLPSPVLMIAMCLLAIAGVLRSRKRRSS